MRLVRTFLQCWRIFLTSSAQKTFNSLPSPRRAHMAHSQCQFKFTFQALWETRESESARRRKSQLFVGLQSWFGERPTTPCYVSSEAAITGLFWVDPYALKSSLIIKCGLWAACVIDLHAPEVVPNKVRLILRIYRQEGNSSHTLCVHFSYLHSHYTHKK